MLSRPAMLFALLGLAGLWLPLVQFRPNRIAAGQGLSLADSIDAGPVLALFLAAVLLGGCWQGWRPILRIVVALAGLGALVLALGLAARHLPEPGNKLARVAPSSGFWLGILAFALMAADAIARLRPSIALRAALLGAALGMVALVLGAGLLDDVSVMREYAARRDIFAQQAQAHLVLAFGSLGLALLVGLPLGVAIYQTPRLRGPVLSVLNVLQTIPSLALFGIMIPLLAAMGLSGIGMGPALIALFLYALLPVVSNTLAGLSAVPATAREAALGLGMTRAQLLMQVLIPLGLPSLLAAIRIVLVQNIGLAVIAGLIGGGGFGTFVFQGLNQTAMDLVLLGALPTIALALIAGIVMDLLVDATQAKEAA